MTADDLRALSAAATPGPWERCDIGSNCGENVYTDERCSNFTDADLIVWLRNHADALADLIDFVRELANEGRPLEADDYQAFYACSVAGARDALSALDADA